MAARAHRLTQAAHAAAIAQRFGLGGGARLGGPVARGLQGVVWRMTTAEGAFAVKEILVRVEEDEMRRNAELTAAAVAAGVLAPASVPTTDGHLIAEVDGSQVRVYEWVDLLEPDIGVDPGEVGRTVAAIHRAGPPTSEPVHPWYTDVVGERDWSRLLEQVADGGAPFAAGVAAVLGEVLELEALVRAPRDLRVCHRDLWADNLRPAAQGGLWVIDWDNAGAASASQELAMVVFEFGTGPDGRADAGRARELTAAYRDAGGPGRIGDASDFSMVIAVVGHILQMHLRGWLAATPADGAANEAGVAEILDRGLTRRVMEDLLDAVAD